MTHSRCCRLSASRPAEPGAGRESRSRWAPIAQGRSCGRTEACGQIRPGSAGGGAAAEGEQPLQGGAGRAGLGQLEHRAVAGHAGAHHAWSLTARQSRLRGPTARPYSLSHTSQAGGHRLASLCAALSEHKLVRVADLGLGQHAAPPAVLPARGHPQSGRCEFGPCLRRAAHRIRRDLINGRSPSAAQLRPWCAAAAPARRAGLQQRAALSTLSDAERKLEDLVGKQDTPLKLGYTMPGEFERHTGMPRHRALGGPAPAHALPCSSAQHWLQTAPGGRTTHACVQPAGWAGPAAQTPSTSGGRAPSRPRRSTPTSRPPSRSSSPCSCWPTLVRSGARLAAAACAAEPERELSRSPAACRRGARSRQGTRRT